MDDIQRQYPELLFQQDNAKGHASAFTKSVLAAAGIKVMEWPPFSPDLNPIETLWNDMKEYIQENYLRSIALIRDYERLFRRPGNRLHTRELRNLYVL